MSGLARNPKLGTRNPKLGTLIAHDEMSLKNGQNET